jgi:hypothetical protein
MVGLLIVGACLALLVWGMAAMFWMPGTRLSGPLPPLTDTEAMLADALRADVKALSAGIGERNVGRYEALQAAADYIDASFEAAGYVVSRQRYVMDSRPYDNIEVERKGTTLGDEIIVGARALRHRARIARRQRQRHRGGGHARPRPHIRGSGSPRTVRFVAFVNEEAPYAHTARMGSVVYAAHARERGERVTAMVSLETMGYFADEPGSQRYPSVLRWIYPEAGNFIAFVSNLPSRRLLKDAVVIFRRHASVPSEGGALPERLPGVRMVRPLGVLAAGLPRDHGHRHRALPLPGVPQRPGHHGQGGFRAAGAGRRGPGTRRGRPRRRKDANAGRDRVDLRTDGLHPADRSM